MIKPVQGTQSVKSHQNNFTLILLTSLVFGDIIRFIYELESVSLALVRVTTRVGSSQNCKVGPVPFWATLQVSRACSDSPGTVLPTPLDQTLACPKSCFIPQFPSFPHQTSFVYQLTALFSRYFSIATRQGMTLSLPSAWGMLRPLVCL